MGVEETEDILLLLVEALSANSSLPVGRRLQQARRLAILLAGKVDFKGKLYNF